MPAYLAARRRRLPLVVHEQNALPGLANKARRPARRRGSRSSFPDTPLPHARVRRPADPPDDLPARPGRAARRGAGVLRPRPRPADAARDRRLAGRPPAQPGRLRRRPGARRRRRPGAARRRPEAARPTPEPTGAPYVVLAVRRPDGPRLRRRRPRGLPGRRQQRHRGRRRRAARRLRAAADRQRRAGRSTPARSSTPAAACWWRDAALTPEWVAATRARRWPPTPTRLAAMGAAAAGADPARRRRAAGPDRPRGRRGERGPR